MSSTKPSVTEVSTRAYDVINASTCVRVEVPHPGVFHVQTRKGQQLVVGHTVCHIDARARLSDEGVVSIERLSLSYRYGPQTEPLAPEVHADAEAQLYKLIRQAAPAAPDGWRTTLGPRKRTAAQLEAELALAVADAQRHLGNMQSVTADRDRLDGRVRDMMRLAAEKDREIGQLKARIDEVRAADEQYYEGVDA